MGELAAAVFTRTPANDSVLVLDGYGLGLTVHRGALVVEDGIGTQRRKRTLYRAQRTVQRIVIIGSTGSISLAALRWCADTGIALVVIDPADRGILAASAPTVHDDARLRRAQALAGDTDIGLAIARDLIHAKIAGQADVVRTVFGDADTLDLINGYFGQLADAPDVNTVRSIEANVAAVYFRTWTALRVKFARADQVRIPPRWTQFDQRTSDLTNGHAPRAATNPVNALLNYCYTLLEVEAVLACYGLGLDPGLGVLHRDKKGRDSLALDLMEPARPVVDRYVLELVNSHTFDRSDITQTRNGQVRLLAPLTHTLAESMPAWRATIAPHAEAAAHAFAALLEGTSRRRTPLTGKTRTSPRRRTAATPLPRPEPRCTECGGPLGDRRRSVCPTCFKAGRMQLARDREAQTRKRLDGLLALGKDTATKPAGSVMRSAKVSWNRCANDLWNLEHPDDPRDEAQYRREILPGIAALPIQVIAERLGMAQDAAWRIREGKLIPHKRHWDELTALGAS